MKLSFNFSSKNILMTNNNRNVNFGKLDDKVVDYFYKQESEKKPTSAIEYKEVADRRLQILKDIADAQKTPDELIIGKNDRGFWVCEGPHCIQSMATFSTLERATKFTNSISSTAANCKKAEGVSNTIELINGGVEMWKKEMQEGEAYHSKYVQSYLINKSGLTKSK